MTIGLNEQELQDLFSFGNSEDDIMNNVFGTTEDGAISRTAMIAHITMFIRRKMVEIVIANNKRIENQLAAINIKLSS